MKPFDLAAYVKKSARASGVPTRVRSLQVLALIARLLSR